MINFRAKDELGTSVAFVTGLAALVAVSAYALFVPVPSLAGLQKAQKNEQLRIVQDVDRMQDEYVKAQAVVVSRTWTQPQQEIHPAVLNKVSSLARANRVKMTALRPQRAGEAGELQTIPFVLSAEGSYPDVVRFVTAIENPANKLAVNLLQLSSADGESDRVTATVGLVAFRREVPADEAPAVKKESPKPQAPKPDVKTEVKKNG
jgi:Tfp pilus assembly protein PilO